MLDPTTLVILVLLAVAVLGALRFDLFGMIWRDLLKMGGTKPELPPAPPPAHGPYQGSSGAQGHGENATHKPADLHRSGKRS